MGVKKILLVQLCIVLIICAIIFVSLNAKSTHSESFLNPSGQQLVDERCIVAGVPVLDHMNGGLMTSSQYIKNGKEDKSGVTCSFLSGSMVGSGGGDAGVEREPTTGQRLIACDGREKPYFDKNFVDSVTITKNKECMVHFKKDLSAEDAQKYNKLIYNKRLGTDENALMTLQSQLTTQEERNEVLRREISRIEEEIRDIKKSS